MWVEVKSIEDLKKGDKVIVYGVNTTIVGVDLSEKGFHTDDEFVDWDGVESNYFEAGDWNLSTLLVWKDVTEMPEVSTDTPKFGPNNLPEFGDILTIDGEKHVVVSVSQDSIKTAAPTRETLMTCSFDTLAQLCEDWEDKPKDACCDNLFYALLHSPNTKTAGVIWECVQDQAIRNEIVAKLKGVV